MGVKYENSLFDVLGVSEEIGLQAIAKLSNFRNSGHKLNILYKRWGDDFKNGNLSLSNYSLTRAEQQLLREEILPELRDCILMVSKPEKNPIIIEHRTEVDKYLGIRKPFYDYIKQTFSEYEPTMVSKVIFNLAKNYGVDYKDYEQVLIFAKDNEKIVREKLEKMNNNFFSKSDLEPKLLNYEEPFGQLLRHIKEKFFSTYSLEDVIKATKIAMLKNGLKNYENCISVLSYIIDNRFGVFRILKTGLTEETNFLITTALYTTNKEGHEFLNLSQFLASYFNGIDSGYSKEEVIAVLSEHYRISERLVIEILEHQIPEFKLTSGSGRD